MYTYPIVFVLTFNICCKSF